MASDPSEKPWYAAYPAPRNHHTGSINRDELLELLNSRKEVGKDFVLIDLRRTDFEVRWHWPQKPKI